MSQMKLSQKVSVRQIPNIQPQSFAEYIKLKLEEYDFYEIAHLIRGYSFALLKQISHLNDNLSKLVQLNIREPSQQQSSKRRFGANILQRIENSKQKNEQILLQNQENISKKILNSQKEDSVINQNQELPLNEQIDFQDPFENEIFQPENSASKMQEFYDRANQLSGQKNNLLFDQDQEIFSKEFQFAQGQNFSDFHFKTQELKELEEKFSIQEDTNISKSEKQTSKTKNKLDKQISEDIENVYQHLEHLENFKKNYQDLIEDVFEQKLDDLKKVDFEDRQLQELIDTVQGNIKNEQSKLISIRSIIIIRYCLQRNIIKREIKIVKNRKQKQQRNWKFIIIIKIQKQNITQFIRSKN